MMSDSDTIGSSQDPTDGSSQKPSVPAMAPLPCPFCGGKPTILDTCHKIVCLNAGCDCYAESAACNSQIEAIQAWNKRAKGSNISEAAGMPTS